MPTKLGTPITCAMAVKLSCFDVVKSRSRQPPKRGNEVADHNNYSSKSKKTSPNHLWDIEVLEQEEYCVKFTTLVTALDMIDGLGKARSSTNLHLLLSLTRNYLSWLYLLAQSNRNWFLAENLKTQMCAYSYRLTGVPPHCCCSAESHSVLFMEIGHTLLRSTAI